VELADIGLNLMHRRFDPDRSAVLERAKAAGVTRMVLTGTCLSSSQATAAYALEYPGQLYSTAGIHPHDTERAQKSDLQALRHLAAQSQVVAIGECGLDFNRDFSPRPVQEAWFEAQVALASELQKPLFLHEREAQPRLLEILAGFQGALPACVVHCFTGSASELALYLAQDFYIGITGWICDERRGLHLQEIVSQIPLNRLMLETDAPFLTPRDLRPKPKNGRNEPAFLPHILSTVARCYGLPEETVAAASFETTRQFFRI